MSRCYAYIVAYISRLEIGNVVLRPARLEVGHYDKKAIFHDFAWETPILKSQQVLSLANGVRLLHYFGPILA